MLEQFEDFQSKWAFKLLQRYRTHYRMFNDDIQVSYIPETQLYSLRCCAFKLIMRSICTLCEYGFDPEITIEQINYIFLWDYIVLERIFHQICQIWTLIRFYVSFSRLLLADVPSTPFQNIYIYNKNVLCVCFCLLFLCIVTDACGTWMNMNSV